MACKREPSQTLFTNCVLCYIIITYSIDAQVVSLTGVLFSDLLDRIVTCPDGSAKVPCPLDACVRTICMTQPDAICFLDPCDNCQPVYYSSITGAVVDCYDGSLSSAMELLLLINHNILVVSLKLELSLCFFFIIYRIIMH